MKDLCQNLFFPLRRLRLQRKDVKTCRRKALRHEIAFAACLLITCRDVLSVTIAHLINLNRSSLFSVLPQQMSGGCWYRICLWSDLQGLGCTGCYNDRCCGGYS